MFDLTPAADRLAGLVRTVTDGDLKAPTPCPGYTVGDLLDHVNGLSVAFTMAALKTPLEGAGSGDASRLPLDFRESVPQRLAELAKATGQPFEVEEDLLQVVHGNVSSIGPDDRDGSLFGAAVEVGSNAPLLDRVLGLSGRDPGWA
ncbi:maleylpyruvate isomerase family mycothiol-dependent enzyme [Lentzea californiensis]|uniref:maleylpyruvate isomerase family mycothiol-dependent enzyme n=1 Tax=Lentzea californiensis TaxID=438851 RepID=UPI0021663A03|nr:maleylpyruvate isomerase family mycothiol-dependent enzyme [Lentzea californiensis]MCR3751170.1 TIGR03083 family protein [Lentzea californiensis]